MTSQKFDIVIIGAGIAGASLASRLAPGFRIAMVERESQPGYHSTGRSAAIFSEVYGSPAVRALSRATRPFLLQPPIGFADHPLLRTCGVMFVARTDQAERLADFAAQPDVSPATRRLSVEQARALLPVLREEYLGAALLEPAAAEIDVHALHHGFLRQARANGAVLVTDCEVTGLTRTDGLWNIETPARRLTAPIVVNAAGAWADELARLAGVAPVGIEPRRRTALIVDAPAAEAIDHWPMTVDIDEEFYLKPDAGRLLISPADETPVEPCDCQPEEYDVALAIHRVEQATTLEIRRVQNKWAGLRSFAPDRNPVIGFDPAAPGFFWLAGQGGYGIQTSYGAAELAAALLAGGPLPASLADKGLDPMDVAPGRFVDRAVSTEAGKLLAGCTTGDWD